MRALASHALEPFFPYGKYQPSPGIFPVAPVSVTHSDGALLQRKSNCACGGDCPSCFDDEHAGNIQTKLQSGQRWLAHELTHTVQRDVIARQRDTNITETESEQREAEVAGSEEVIEGGI